MEKEKRFKSIQTLSLFFTHFVGDRIRANLQKFMEKTDANAVYTLVKNGDDTVEFIVDADDEPVELGYQYNLLEEMREAFAGTVSAEEEISSDE